jgi:RimJ/RimL family protein N-acetyltransferase
VKLLFGQSQAVVDFVQANIGIDGIERGFGNCQAVGVVDGNGALVGGMIYHDWSPERGVIELSIAATNPRWITRDVLQFMMDYPFITCGCQMLYQRNAASNERANNILRRWGYNEIKIPRMLGRDKDGVVFTLYAEQWEAHRKNRRNRK